MGSKMGGKEKTNNTGVKNLLVNRIVYTLHPKEFWSSVPFLVWFWTRTLRCLLFLETTPFLFRILPPLLEIRWV